MSSRQSASRPRAFDILDILDRRDEEGERGSCIRNVTRRHGRNATAACRTPVNVARIGGVRRARPRL
jgi:hypothetical protein